MTVAQVRTIIADDPNPADLTLNGDGVSTRYQLPYFPVTAGTLAVAIGGTPTAAWTLAADTGLVVFDAAPGDGATIVATWSHTLLSDTGIETFLDLCAADVLLAAAMALDTIASNEALVSKKIKLLDITTDGPAVAAALRAHAERLRTQAGTDDEFDIAEMVVDDFTYRRRIANEAARGTL